MMRLVQNGDAIPRFVAIFGLLLMISACNETQGNIQKRVDNNILKHTISKPYAEIAVLKKTTLDGIFSDDRAYGELFAVTTLEDGDNVYRHLDRYESGESSSSIGNLVTRSKTQFSYRLIYFRVNGAGTIIDFANGFLVGETSSCVGWISGIFQKCEDEAAMLVTVGQYDNLVKTSSGKPLTSWPFTQTVPANG